MKQGQGRTSEQGEASHPGDGVQMSMLAWGRHLPGFAVALAAAVGASVLAPPAQAEVGPSNPDIETVTAAPLPTWQTNGTVWDMEIVDGVVYVAGNFTSVRPPGSAAGVKEVPRLRLAAFDANTGALLPWAPNATAPLTTVTPGSTIDKNCTPVSSTQIECATVWSLDATPDKSALILGGDFRYISGTYRQGLAAVSPSTGALVASFAPRASGRVYAVEATNSAVFVGGGPLTAVNGVARSQLAAIDYPSGQLRVDWAPSVTSSDPTQVVINGVRALALTKDESRLLVGGGFDKLNSTAIHGIGAIDTATGATGRWDTARIFSRAFVTSLNVYGDTAYTTADALGSASEGIIAYDAMTGLSTWYDSCRGASHSMALVRGVVYVGSHAHDCGVMDDAFPENYQGYASGDRRRYTLRAEVPASTPGRGRLLQWFPQTNDGNGARAMATDDTNLWIGGEFTSVDKVSQQGLTRFSFLGVNSAADHKPYTPQPPVVTATSPTSVDVTWQQVEDPDNVELQYWVIKDGKYTTPIFTTTSKARPWLLGWHTYRDMDVKPGETHTYDIRAIDPLGTRSNRSSPTSVTVPADFPPAASIANADRAAVHYSFDSLQGGRFVDSVSGRTASVGSGVSSVAGPHGQAVNLSGGTGGAVIDGLREYSTRQFSLEAMFSTTTNRGGVLVSLGDSASLTSTSSNNTGSLYMDNTGRLNLGLYPDGVRTDPWQSPFRIRAAVRTPDSYNDGKWHHVVATFEPRTGSRIFIDGVKVAEDPSMNWSRSVNAYIRIGGDRVVSWPNAPTSAFFQGRIDQVALYRRPLSETQVIDHAASLLGTLVPPASLRALGVRADGVDLAWASVRGATEYDVLRDGVPVGTAATTAFTDTTVEGSTSYNYQVRATNASGPGPLSEPLSVTTAAPPPPPPLALVVSGDEWKYQTKGSPDEGWMATEFDDSSWLRGPSQLGYGDGDEATVLTSLAADGTTRRITTYFRRSVVVEDASLVKSVSLRVKRDDGVIIYINGVEVFRDNMPSGAISTDTLATTWASDDGNTWRTVTVPASAFATGVNAVSAEVHQSVRGTNSNPGDMSFDLELTAIR